MCQTFDFSGEALSQLADLTSFDMCSEPEALRGVTILSVDCQDVVVATLVDDCVQLLDSICTAFLASIDVWLGDAGDA